MKRLFLTLALFVSVATVTAQEPVQFFTSGQASRVVDYLNGNPEILIYSGHPDYPPAYVYTTDVWKERYNGTSYYEVWICGYDINTNEEIMTPVDLNCIWVNNLGTPVMVAQRLGFAYTPCRISFRWVVPVYIPRPRVPHTHVYHQNFFRQPHLIRHHGHGTPPPPTPARMNHGHHGYGHGHGPAHGPNHGAPNHRQVAQPQRHNQPQPPRDNPSAQPQRRSVHTGSPAQPQHGPTSQPARRQASPSHSAPRQREVSSRNDRPSQVKSNGGGRRESPSHGRDSRGGRR